MLFSRAINYLGASVEPQTVYSRYAEYTIYGS